MPRNRNRARKNRRLKENDPPVEIAVAAQEKEILTAAPETKTMSPPMYLWHDMVLSPEGETQYGHQAFSACTTMALESMRLLLARQPLNADLVTRVLKFGASFYGTNSAHTSVEDVSTQMCAFAILVLFLLLKSRLCVASSSFHISVLNDNRC